MALPTVFDGFLVTVQVALSVIVIGIGTGLALALLRCAENPLVNGVISLYVEVFRTLPQLVNLGAGMDTRPYRLESYKAFTNGAFGTSPPHFIGPNSPILACV